MIRQGIPLALLLLCLGFRGDVTYPRDKRKELGLFALRECLNRDHSSCWLVSEHSPADCCVAYAEARCPEDLASP